MASFFVEIQHPFSRSAFKSLSCQGENGCLTMDSMNRLWWPFCILWGVSGFVPGMAGGSEDGQGERVTRVSVETGRSDSAPVVEQVVVAMPFGQGQADPLPPHAAMDNDRSLTGHGQQSVSYGPEMPYVFDIAITLQGDSDTDGYFRQLSFSVDVDVDQSFAEVFLEVLIRRGEGQWEPFYTTENFEVAGFGVDDRYTFHAVLAGGYPTGRYDFMVVLHRAGCCEAARVYGPAHFPQMAGLYLEDEKHDIFIDDHNETALVEVYGGGTIAVEIGIVLLGWMAFRIRRPTLP